jgi:acetolactate synthase-1/2/3 large subunit
LQGALLPENFSSLITRPIEIIKSDSNILPEYLENLIKELSNSKRPVIFAGSGVRISGTEAKLLELAEILDIPVVTAWTHDIFPNNHELFAGRPGTIGTRAGNFVVQNADLVLILGSRLNIRQVSYNWKSFARNAKKIWVDIDPAEFEKPFIFVDFKIKADLRLFLPSLIEKLKLINWTSCHATWKKWCQTINKKYTPQISDYPISADAINPYHFIYELFENLEPNDIVVCGDATATIVPFQIGRLKAGMRMISNSGSASMGYDIPAALGAAVANPNARIICLAGDGSSMMNIQELETIKNLKLNLRVIILNNDGYLSIKQTQRNFFKREAGSSSSSGLSFPDFKKLGEAFGLYSIDLKKERWQSKLKEFIGRKGPCLCNAFLDLTQEFEPRLKSKMLDGVITTPELDDMHPFLDSKELAEVRSSALEINN